MKSFKVPEIKMTTYFLTGSILFFFIGVAGLGLLLTSLPPFNLDFLRALASNIFNLLTGWLFAYLYQSNKIQQTKGEVDDLEVKSMLEELEKNAKNRI